MHQAVSKFTTKNFIIFSLTFALLILVVIGTIWSQPIQKSDAVLLTEQTFREQRLYKVDIQKESGVTLDPENMPKGLTLFE